MTDALQAFLDSGWLARSFAAIALGSTLVIIAVILSENRNPVKSAAITQIENGEYQFIEFYEK